MPRGVDDDGTVIDLLHSAFEETDLPAVAAAVRAGKADDRLDRYHREWRSWAQTWQPPTDGQGRLRPYLFNNWSGHDGGGLAAAWMDLVGRSDSGPILHQQLVRHLLFCDGVAVPDPFIRMVGSTGRPRITGMIADRPAIRMWAAAAIESVHAYRDLIDDGILVVVPAPANFPRLAEAASSVVAADPLMLDHFAAPPAGWWGLTEPQIAAIDLFTQIATAGGAFDPYLPTRGHLAVFRKLATSTEPLIGAGVEASSAHEHSALLPSVLGCQLPDPGAVTLTDVIAIRRDGQFAAWRDAVAEGVRRFRHSVGDDPEQWPNAAEGLRRSIGEQVRAEAERQKTAIGWSRHPSVDVSVDLLLVAGSAAAAFATPPVAAALAGLEAVKLLNAMTRRWRFAHGAFGRHVAVFTQSG